MTWSSWMGGGGCPNFISQLRSSKFGFMVSGMPSCSVKKDCTGDLQRLTHMPTQLLSACTAMSAHGGGRCGSDMTCIHALGPAGTQHTRCTSGHTTYTVHMRRHALDAHAKKYRRRCLTCKISAFLDVHSAALLLAFNFNLCYFHGPNQPAEEVDCKLGIDLGSPLGVWKQLPEPGRNTWKAINDSVPLLCRRFALQPEHACLCISPCSM